MAYRAAFYTLILAVGVMVAIGFGFLNHTGQGAGRSRSVVAAAPLGGSTDNSGGDNGSSSSSDNTGDNAGCASATPAFASSLAASLLAGSGAATDNSGDNGTGISSDNSGDNASCAPVVVVAAATPTLTPTPKPAAAPLPPPTVVQGPCYFALGFADFHRTLSGKDGDCLENEHPDPNGTGDEVQATSLPAPSGLMVWQKFTNSMRWTDGSRTFTYSKCLLQERLNTETFAWERNPSLLVPESAPVPAGACDKV